MPNYTAFGLTINSEIELSPLLSSNTVNADIRISYGKVNKSGLTAATKIRPFSQFAENELWLHIPEVAWFYVTNGNKIIVQADETSDIETIKLFLLGTCMGAIIHQLNHLVIHGNAIRFGDQCVIFAGKSGNGKSTLAAAFHQRGYEILADDLAVIDRQQKVQPSYPQIKLWHDTAKQLGIDVSGLKRIRPQIDKYAYPIQHGFCSRALPVKAIYMLHTHNQNTFLLDAITGADKFTYLRDNTYRIKQLDGLGLKQQHFKMSSQLANKIDMNRITRPNDGFDLNTLVNLVEQDLEKE